MLHQSASKWDFTLLLHQSGFIEAHRHIDHRDQFIIQPHKAGLSFTIIFCVSEGTERSEGRRRARGSLDEDDPNILLAIQLSLQESRRDRNVEGGVEREHGLDRGQERRPATAGDQADVALQALNTEGPPGARGSSFPTSLLDPPRPPNRTDSASQPSISNSLPLPPPPPSLSAELLELGDSLMKLGNITTPYDLDTHTQEQLRSHLTYNHSALTAPYTTEPSFSDCSHGQDQKTLTTPSVLEHIAITDPLYKSKEQSYCHATAYLPEVQHTASCVLECTQNPTQLSSYNREHAATYDSTPKSDGSYHPCPERSSPYTAEHPSTYSLEQPHRSDSQTPAQLCLPSPELKPELLPSPVIPPGGPFTPSDPQSLEPLDPTASAQLLDNIMAWFNNNINPQNNPQSLALIPSPPTTESDSSPDTHPETEAESQTSQDTMPAHVRQPLEGEPKADWASMSLPLGAVGASGPKTLRPSSLELENRDVGEEAVNAGCVAELSLDEVHTHPCSHSQCGSSPAHTALATERDLDPVLHLEGCRPPEEWEEQEHLV